jgi:hypothetical protein
MNDPVKTSSNRARNTVIVLAVAGVIVYTAMPKSAHWQEEASLSDGTRLVVDRSLVYGARSEIGQGPAIAKWTLEFKLPATGKTVTFEAPGGLEIVLLDADAGALYLVARASRGDAYYAFGCPNPPFLFHKYADGWKRIPPAEFPAKFVKANLPVHSAAYEKLANSGVRLSAERIRELNEQKSLDPESTRIWTKPTPDAGKTSICGKPA